MSESTYSIILTILVLLVMAFFVIKGYRKGFLRILFSTFQFIVIILVAALLVVPTAKMLASTTFGEKIEEKVSEFVDEKVDSYFEEKTGIAITDQEQSEDTEELPDIISLANDSDIEEEDANEIIDSLALPTFVKSLFKDSPLESSLNAFKADLTEDLTQIILKALAFIGLMIIVSILMQIILHLLKFIGKIPIIGGINKLLGAILGLVEAMILLWVLGIALMIFASTDFAAEVIKIIHGNAFLSLIYDNNYLLILGSQLFGMK